MELKVLETVKSNLNKIIIKISSLEGRSAAKCKNYYDDL